MRLKLCGEAGCSELVRGGYYCPRHKALADKRKAEHERERFSNAKRHANYSDPRWRRLSHDFREAHPYCQYCGSTDRLEVHHIVSVRNAPERFLDASNLMVLCHACHSVVTAREKKS